MAAIFNLNHPAHTVHWHFFSMSVSNIVVIVLMLVVFAARDRSAVSEARRRRARVVSAVNEKSWTVRVRERAVAALPPEKLLADKQPSYVSSWIYVFGVLSLASLVVIIASGCVLALKGPGWWHFTGIGHFFNSIHMWSVELFFFVMVVHLWGKYWMAAWRGGRVRVWVTGAVTFLVAVPCALTGYVSQQNFDAQWISTQAKDAMNSVGIGAFFNLTNFGQMYSYHVLLLPLAVVGLVVAHVLLVRKHGVVPPFRLEAARRGREPRPTAPAGGVAGVSWRERRKAEDEAARVWTGGYRPYDLVKEFTIALGVILALSVVLTILFSSPDDPASTVQTLVSQRPGRFRHDRGQRARRLERPRRLRPAVQPQRRRPAHTVPASAEVVRGQPPDRYRQGLRDRAAPGDPRPAAAAQRDLDLPVGVGQAADSVDRCLHRGAVHGSRAGCAVPDTRRPTLTARSRSRPGTTVRSRR